MLPLHWFILLSLQYRARSQSYVTCFVFYSPPTAIRFRCRSSCLIWISAPVLRYTTRGHFLPYRRQSKNTLPGSSIYLSPESSIICKQHTTSKSNTTGQINHTSQREWLSRQISATVIMWHNIAVSDNFHHRLSPPQPLLQL
jgi:hypothetical protein